MFIDGIINTVRRHDTFVQPRMVYGASKSTSCCTDSHKVLVLVMIMPPGSVRHAHGMVNMVYDCRYSLSRSHTQYTHAHARAVHTHIHTPTRARSTHTHSVCLCVCVCVCVCVHACLHACECACAPGHSRHLHTHTCVTQVRPLKLPDATDVILLLDSTIFFLDVREPEPVAHACRQHTGARLVVNRPAPHFPCIHLWRSDSSRPMQQA